LPAASEPGGCPSWCQQLEQLRIRQGLALLESLDPLIAEVETELLQCSTSKPWAALVPLLVQLPGIGALNAMLLLAAIGDIPRFPTAKKLVGYSGLGVSIHSSGETQYSGGITKEGRREIRTTMVEAAWVAVERHPYWKEAFQRLAARCGKRKAIVAIARKLLVVVWHVLTEQVADRHAEAEAVARKLLRWGSAKGIARRSGSSRAAFVRQHLIRLGLGAELTTITFGREVVTLPSVAALTGGG
jgi:transposase